MYNVVNSDVYPSLSNSLTLETVSHRYDTRNTEMLRPPFPRVDAQLINYQYQFIEVWNGIPASVKFSPSAYSFKRALKEYFLNQY